jgi:hypothetical protein
MSGGNREFLDAQRRKKQVLDTVHEPCIYGRMLRPQGLALNEKQIPRSLE